MKMYRNKFARKCNGCQKMVAINKGYIWVLKGVKPKTWMVYHDECLPSNQKTNIPMKVVINEKGKSSLEKVDSTYKEVVSSLQSRPTMKDIWMELALKLKDRSTCQRLQVGAVITSQNLERVYSIGYNGGAKGQSNECESLEPGQCGHLHAEINALIKCQVNDPYKILFVSTHPCKLCAKAIVNSGFSKIVFHEPYRNEHSAIVFGEAQIGTVQL